MFIIIQAVYFKMLKHTACIPNKIRCISKDSEYREKLNEAYGVVNREGKRR